MPSARPNILAVLALVLLALAAGGTSAAGGAAADSKVSVFFTKGEQLAAVKRDPGERPPLEAALATLLEGPTAGEHERGFRTSIRPGTALRGVTVRGGVARVDLSRAFAAGARPALQTRLVQLVFTATQFDEVRAVRVAIEGKQLAQLGGISLDPPPTRADLRAQPEGGPPQPPPPPPAAFSPLVRDLQTRLVELRYLPRGAVDGLFGPQTRNAILAFQKWEGLRRDGRATRAILARARDARTPRPRPGGGSRIEVYLEKQVALLVSGGRTVRALHVSTGAPASPTPPGSYQVFRKELRSWSVPFRIWLPYASYFVGGIAFHESLDVPPHPASHGCVRIPSHDARLVYEFASLGTPVLVR